MQQAQQQRQRQRDLARNAPRVQCETRQGEPRRLLWSNKMPATDQREGGADTMQAGCSSSPRERTKTKKTANWQLAIGNCELPTAQSRTVINFSSGRQSVAGFELWLDLSWLRCFSYSHNISARFSIWSTRLCCCCCCIWFGFFLTSLSPNWCVAAAHAACEPQTDRTYISDYRAGLANSQPRCSTSSERCVPFRSVALRLRVPCVKKKKQLSIC